MIIISILYTTQIFSKNILSVDFGGKRKIINTHQYSNTGKYIIYTIEGTFTDNFANYGSWDTMVIAQVEKGKILNMDLSTMWEYQNLSKVYFKGRRGDSDEDTGIGKVIVIGADESMKMLINTKCTYSVKILNENVFGVQKCELSKDAFNTLKDLDK